MGRVTAFTDSSLGETKAVKAELHLIKKIIHMFVFWRQTNRVNTHCESDSTTAAFKTASKLSVYVQTLNTSDISNLQF